MAERNDIGYNLIRKKVLARDNHRCQMPGCKRKRKLEVHHIIKYSTHHHLRCEERNLIVLCRGCHNKLRNKEILFAPMLIDIVGKKYKK